MAETNAANSGSTRRIMPEAVLVCAVRLPVLPAPSPTAESVLALFSDTSRVDGPVVHILN